jgi:hypothetical protein
MYRIHKSKWEFEWKQLLHETRPNPEIHRAETPAGALKQQTVPTASAALKKTDSAPRPFPAAAAFGKYEADTDRTRNCTGDAGLGCGTAIPCFAPLIEVHICGCPLLDGFSAPVSQIRPLADGQLHL